jgi:hypothetical protein
MLTTPKAIGESVTVLAEKFGLSEEPVWVPVRSRQVAEFGGEIVYGWQIWEWPRIMVEGEFHAVWRSPTGELLDVSTKPDGETQILFIPDPTRRYEARQIDNCRLALWDHNLVHDFITLSERLHQIFDEGRISELASSIDAEEYTALELRRASIQKKLMSFPRARQTV